MVEKGFKVTHEKKGKPLCCFAISTIILLIALGAVAFVYRETLIEKFNNITSESSGSEYVDNNSDDLELTTLNFYDMEDVTEDSKENMTLTIEETTESFSDEEHESSEKEKDNFNFKDLLIEYESNESDDEESNEAPKSVQKNSKALSIDHIRDIFKNDFKNTSDEISDTTRLQVWKTLFKTPSSSTTTESPETTKDSVISGSGDDSNYKKSKTNTNGKVISYDDEDYIEGST